MPELFLELFSEEIPARMQARAAEILEIVVRGAVSPQSPRNVKTYFGPRRIAYSADLDASLPPVHTSARGPRHGASDQAVDGFLRKYGLQRPETMDNEGPVRIEDGYWVVRATSPEISTAATIAQKLPDVLRRFSWPKSMRWGGTSTFTWVRPLRRIVCLFDGQVVPFDLRDGTDDGHGLASGNLTEGHRFHAPGAFPVSGAVDWAHQLGGRQVLVNADDRKRVITEGLARLTSVENIAIVDDPGLLDEVAGLVEWPVPLLGRIASEHMDLPPEVMRVSMRVNQRYFSTRTFDGTAAPWFAFVANIDAEDGGATIVAGNERVLKARFADARHFWDLDRKAPLEGRVPSLDHVTYHAKLGTQGARVIRLRALARTIAPLVGSGAALADRAAELAKADLVTGMVGEFPEVQGVMGRYYALHDNEDAYVADAIRDHYMPRGPTDHVPTAPVSIAVALADKLDQLACFFAIDERPTGAGDPYALRRAALGAIRIVRENALRLPLLRLLDSACGAAREAAVAAAQYGAEGPGKATRPIAGTDRHVDALAFDILDFLAERLRVQLRAEGARHDVLAAVFAAGSDDDIVRLLARSAAVAALLGQDDGANLLAAYRRAANILRIEEKKDGPHGAAPDPALLSEPAEHALAEALAASHVIESLVQAENYAEAMAEMAKLRAPLDIFFEKVTVNAPDPQIRRNRLRLLSQVRSTMDRVADFSRIEG